MIYVYLTHFRQTLILIWKSPLSAVYQVALHVFLLIFLSIIRVHVHITPILPLIPRELSEWRIRLLIHHARSPVRVARDEETNSLSWPPSIPSFSPGRIRPSVCSTPSVCSVCGAGGTRTGSHTVSPEISIGLWLITISIVLKSRSLGILAI